MTAAATGPMSGGVARIGPNALIQAGHALDHLFGPVEARRIFSAASLLSRYEHPPGEMIAETEARSLFDTMRAGLSAEAADAALSEAGRRTAAYLVANRIPTVIGRVLPRLPAGVSARFLARAISRNAWTFAGSGRFSSTVSGLRHPSLAFTIDANPIATPGCPWHVAVFSGLFRTLVDPAMTARHTECIAEGGRCCCTLLERRR